LLISNFNFEYNPVSAVLAGIVSQEVFNVLTNPSLVKKGLYTFDGNEEFGDFN
jgi:hypothetical protein